MTENLLSLRDTLQKMSKQLPKYDGLTQKQSVKVFKFKNLLDIKHQGDNIAFEYLRETEWNLSVAMDTYYCEKLNYKYIWEWQNVNNEWIPYLDHRIKQFDELKVGESCKFDINGHEYTFNKISEYSGHQKDVIIKYKVVDMLPVNPLIATYKVNNHAGNDLSLVSILLSHNLFSPHHLFDL